jgi:pimeloyl-ACP methyl ester carboxylesterase
VALPERPRRFRPGIFSVSFGSYPALRVASAPQTSGLVGGLVVFGGYADPDSTIRFNIGSAVPGAPPVDPTSLVGVALNILDGFEDKPEETGPVLAGWYEFARVTWGHPEFRDAERSRVVANTIAARMEPEQADFFLLGCGFADGAQRACLGALERWGQQPTVDPRPHLPGLRCPVYLFHSRLDDVIPCEESAKLLAALPARVRARRYVTGLYEHTRRPPLTDLLRRVPAMTGEGATMLRMLGALVRAGSSP